MSNIPPSLGKPVVSKVINWRSLVIESWGEDWAKRDIAYRFSDGTAKESTDTTNRGFYNGGAK